MSALRHTFAALAALAALAGCGRRAPAERTEWPSMGTVAAVQIRGAAIDGAEARAVYSAVVQVFAEVEEKLNAHSPDSEISRLAALSDGEILKRCSSSMRKCYEAAFALRDDTGGAFDPRWRAKAEAAGAKVAADAPGRLDLGGIAKGFAVDLAAEKAAQCGVDALVDLGGNVKSAKGTWTVGVKDPFGDGFAAMVELAEGEALATSATYYRGAHIRDARSGGEPAARVASATVLARSAMLADGLSTALFVLGPEAGAALLRKLRERGEEVSAMYVREDGGIVRDGGRFGAAPPRTHGKAGARW